MLLAVDTVEEEAANTDLISARDETGGDFTEHSIIVTFPRENVTEYREETSLNSGMDRDEHTKNREYREGAKVVTCQLSNFGL